MVFSWCGKQANKPIRAQEKSPASRCEHTGSLGIGALCSKRSYLVLIVIVARQECGVESQIRNNKTVKRNQRFTCYTITKFQLLLYFTGYVSIPYCLCPLQFSITNGLKSTQHVLNLSSSPIRDMYE